MNNITDNIIVAIPSKSPGGLAAKIDSHFGHCEIYTLVTIANNKIANVQELASIPHTIGGCLAPVQYLADNNVGALIAGGMGKNPLFAFQQKKIAVLHSADFDSVQAAVDSFIAGKLKPFTKDYTCKGTCNH